MFVPSSAHVRPDPGALSQPTLSIRPASSSPRLLPTSCPCSPPGSCRLPPGGGGTGWGGNQWASGWDRGHLYPAPLADILSLGQEHKRGWGRGCTFPAQAALEGLISRPWTYVKERLRRCRALSWAQHWLPSKLKKYQTPTDQKSKLKTAG